MSNLDAEEAKAQMENKNQSESETETMAGLPPHQADQSIVSELNTILPGSEPMHNIYARHEGGYSYSVLSARNGSVTAHRVNLDKMTCTCEDMEYNKEDNNVCAHIAAAIIAPRISVEQQSAQYLMESASIFNDAVEKARTAANTIEQTRVKQVDHNAGVAANSGSSGQSQQATAASGTTVDPADACHKLQSAFDNVIEDMRVENSESFVWVQTGQSTPDTLPGPGNVQPFDAFLRNPDQMMFIPDDANPSQLPDGFTAAAKERPGQWWKNAILPEKVDEYISEVLE